jgi:integration host factor subunit beta
MVWFRKLGIDGYLDRWEGYAHGEHPHTNYKRQPTMTKSELIDAIAARGEQTKAKAEEVVNCVFNAMTEALERGEGIEIRGFGSFTVRPYKPYNGRNPRTGDPVPVPAKRLPFFKVGKELKELVNNSRHIAITGGDDEDD